MKTMIEVQYQEKNVKDGDLDKYVKETLKEQGVKTTEVETLNIYYLPETAKVFFVAIKKDGSELKGELDVNAMPEYPEVVKKPAAKKAPAKKAPAAKAPAKAVAAKEYDRGIIVCRTGIGVSIAANKVKGAYAACIHDVYQAQRAQLSNHANIITMGSQVIGIELAKQLVKEYLSVEWDPNCRSVAKVQRIIDFENEE